MKFQNINVNELKKIHCSNFCVVFLFKLTGSSSTSSKTDISERAAVKTLYDVVFPPIAFPTTIKP